MYCSRPQIIKIRILIIAVLALLLGGCGAFISSAKQEFSSDLTSTILSFDDPEVVGRAVPAYLLLISSMIRGEPDNVGLLNAGARLYSAYASTFSTSGDSKKALAAHAFDYASRSFCLQMTSACGLQHTDFNNYKQFLETVTVAQVEALLLYSSTWAGVIEADSGNWNRIAELPRVKAGMQRVIALDETIDNGNAHLYMAVLESLLPPTLGGKPEKAKVHFERANELSRGKNLMVKVLYAERYARLLFDRKLHDRLLNEVISAKIENDENRLANTLAKQKAKQLLASADDYF